MAHRAAVVIAWLGAASWWLAPSVSRVGPGWQAAAWIPDWAWAGLVLLPAALGLGLSCLLPRRRLIGAVIAIAAVVPPVAGTFRRDLGWSGDPPSPAIRIVYLNAQDPPAQRVEAQLDALLGLDADLVVVVNPGWIPPAWRRRVQGEGEGEGGEQADAEPWSVQWRSPVMVASPHGPSVLRTLVAKDGVRAVRLEPPPVIAERLGSRPILIVDLPSDPALDRDVIADTLLTGLNRADVDGLAEFGLVLGDFNMTPRTPAFARLRGPLDDLVSTRGRGWTATWPRERPLLRIDQVLGRSEPASSIRTFDPGWGGHRGFVMELGRSVGD